MPVVTRSQRKVQEQELEQIKVREQVQKQQLVIVQEQQVQVNTCTELQYNNIKSIINEKIIINERDKEILNNTTNLIQLYNNNNKCTNELIIKQRKNRFQHLKSLSELMYCIKLEIPKLYKSNYEMFMNEFGRITLDTIERFYNSIQQDWDIKFKPQTPDEMVIIKCFLENLRDTEDTLIQLFPDVSKKVIDIERLIC